MADVFWTGGANNGDWGTAANWWIPATGLAAVPVAGDNVFLRDNSKSIVAGLNQSAVALGDVHVDMTYTGYIGTDGAYLQIDPNNLYIGRSIGIGAATGSKFMKIDIGSNVVAVNIYNTATEGLTSTAPALYLKSNNASDTIVIHKGYLGYAYFPGETSLANTIDIGIAGDAASGPTVHIGPGVTVDPTIYSGTVKFQGAATDIILYGGTTTFDTPDGFSLYMRGGKAILVRSGNIVGIGKSGTIDLGQSSIPIPFTSLSLDIGMTVIGSSTATFSVNPTISGLLNAKLTATPSA